MLSACELKRCSLVVSIVPFDWQHSPSFLAVSVEISLILGQSGSGSGSSGTGMTSIIEGLSPYGGPVNELINDDTIAGLNLFSPGTASCGYYDMSTTLPLQRPDVCLIVGFYLFIFLEKGREGESEGEKHPCVVASCVPPTRGLAHNPGMCPNWE